MNHEHRHEPDSGKETISRAKWVFIGFAAIAVFFLIAEHKAHLLSGYLQYWPFLLLLACPLMHIFIPGGHGGHGSHRDEDGTQSDKQSKEKKS